MDKIREGDRGALASLVDRYWSLLATYAKGIVGFGDEADDVVQNAFIRVWRFRTDWKPAGTVSGYLYRITRNLALNAQRDHAFELKRRVSADAAEAAITYQTPQEDHDATILREEIERALANIPARRREVFMLSRFHALTYQEIAETLGISPQTVANQISATLDQLRQALSHRFENP